MESKKLIVSLFKKAELNILVNNIQLRLQGKKADNKLFALEFLKCQLLFKKYKPIISEYGNADELLARLTDWLQNKNRNLYE